ncbi:malto-oligosyltrehalose synthase [Streptomyces malaysiensis subsp. malaysiensis]|uniref:malto-oligosyltrehalose synthase n=1 Tax=Streptomyces malaysiensis TaxID=92644 RepID=UPI000BFDCE80|nr:malto-oligosyltrehalose synthase [Streptomyces malaysiensis]ATL86163.1 alpha-amylase [Streptomyces malaysiensis]QDL70220.1 malto-oligosyltrehalose synthase [Streptomyces malaysiensis]
MTADPGTPTATYRLQLQPAFPFAAAERAVPYLASLGVSHLHLSPVLEAVPGSTHGYDVVDHRAVRAELGGEQGLRSLARTARAHGLGLIVDIVPNHMAAPAPERLNAPLWEVLREGPGSPYARWFDIDWQAQGGKVLLPVLGGPLGKEWERLRVEDGTLRYYDHAFPLRPGTEGLPLAGLLDAQWYRLCWWRLARTELNYRRFFTISELIAVRVEDPEVFDATHATLLRLMRDGVVDGLRIDHPDGLADPEGYLRRLDRAVRAATGQARAGGSGRGAAPEGGSGRWTTPEGGGQRITPEGGGGRWTVVEKILARDERLPDTWPVAGTTGYDALHHIDGLFVDPDGLEKLTALYRAFAAPPADLGGDWAATVRRAAHEVVTHELAAEVARLTRTASRICAADPRLRDHAPWALRTAIRELLVRLPVYRPYASVGGPYASGGRPSTSVGGPHASVGGPSATGADAMMLRSAAADAREAFTVEQEAQVVHVVRDAALGGLGDGPDHRDFCARFAQTAAALRAKSVEDTAFYRYAPLLSAAEVGGDPGRPAVSPEEFHAFAARRSRDWPATGTVLSTHDTKRSADARARLAALTECPAWWGRTVAELTRSAPAPDPHLAWTAWQTALALGHGDAERLVPAVLKAVREAGLRTTWTERNAAYEAEVTAFLEAGPCAADPSVWTAIGAELDGPARANALGAALLQLTMPGVPDLYMGTEHIYTALVDPDNRRPPELGGEPAAQGPSAEKLLLTRAALRLRRKHPGWFGPGSGYTPLTAEGPTAAHCTAFVRTGTSERTETPVQTGASERTGASVRTNVDGPGTAGGERGAVTVVTRLSRRLAEAGGWGATRLPLPPGRWRDLLTERTAEGAVPLAELLARLPVALLVRI